MSPMQVLQMPLRTFWSANRQIDRLRAEQDQRMLQVVLAARSDGEGAKQMYQALKDELGTPMLVIKGFDEAKFLEMQAAMNAG